MTNIIDAKAALGKDFEEGFQKDDYDMELGPYENPKREVSKTIENPHLREYREHFLYGRDREFLLKLATDIYRNAARMKDPQHKNLFPIDQDLEKISKVKLAALLIRHSVRLCALFKAVATQIDQRNEKALIFANNPWEAMLYAILFRALSYKATPGSDSAFTGNGGIPNRHGEGKRDKKSRGPKEPEAKKRKASSGKIKKEPEVKQEAEKMEDKDAGETNPNKDIKDVVDALDITSV